MKTRFAVALLIVAMCCQVSLAKKLRLESFTISAWHAPSPVKTPVIRSTPSVKPWIIPAGKFGVELKNGTRVIGVPSKKWSATLKTQFGKVTIPRDQIAKIETTANGVRVHLKNGDRVSGSLVTGTMGFETEFGKLSVPLSELVRLSTSTVVSEDKGNKGNIDGVPAKTGKNGELRAEDGGQTFVLRLDGPMRFRFTVSDTKSGKTYWVRQGRQAVATFVVKKTQIDLIDSSGRVKVIIDRRTGKRLR